MPKNAIFVAAFCFAAIALAPAARGQQKETAPAQQPRTYNIAFDFGDTPYTGTASLTISKETVTGTMKIDSPMPVTGEVEGTLKGEALILEIPFKMESEGCGGRVHAEGKMDAKRAEASGTAKTDGGCSPDGQPYAGTFSLKAVAEPPK